MMTGRSSVRPGQKARARLNFKQRLSAGCREFENVLNMLAEA